jgi:hypothetical protein
LTFTKAEIISEPYTLWGSHAITNSIEFRHAKSFLVGAENFGFGAENFAENFHRWTVEVADERILRETRIVSCLLNITLW